MLLEKLELINEKLTAVAWTDYLDTDVLKSNLLPQQKDSAQDYLEEELESARQEWLAAKQYFDLVSDPDLIEHAIYSLEAAEKKYNYLLKQKKNQE